MALSAAWAGRDPAPMSSRAGSPVARFSAMAYPFDGARNIAVIDLRTDPALHPADLGVPARDGFGLVGCGVRRVVAD